MLKLLLFVTGILASSFIYGQKDDPVHHELKFTMRALPDNWWYISLHEDGTYEYKHWSGWVPDEGYILEKGLYQMAGDELILDCQEGNCRLSKNRYFIIEVAGYDDSSDKPPYRMDVTKTYYFRIETRK